MNSVNSGKLMNHWRMNWAQFMDPNCYICLLGAVLACWFNTQAVGGSNKPFCKNNFYKFCRFFRINLRKTRLALWILVYTDDWAAESAIKASNDQKLSQLKQWSATSQHVKRAETNPHRFELLPLLARVGKAPKYRWLANLETVKRVSLGSCSQYCQSCQFYQLST